MSQLIRLWYLSHRRPEKAQASLRIHAVSPEPSLFAHMKYGTKRRVRPKIRHLAPLDGCVCAFEEWVYGGRKEPQSYGMAQIMPLLFLVLGQTSIGLLTICTTIYGRSEMCYTPNTFRVEWLVAFICVTIGVLCISIGFVLLVASHWKPAVYSHAKWFGFASGKKRQLSM